MDVAAHEMDRGAHKEIPEDSDDDSMDYDHLAEQQLQNEAKLYSQVNSDPMEVDWKQLIIQTHTRHGQFKHTIQVEILCANLRLGHSTARKKPTIYP